MENVYRNRTAAIVKLALGQWKSLSISDDKMCQRVVEMVRFLIICYDELMYFLYIYLVAYLVAFINSVCK